MAPKKKKGYFSNEEMLNLFILKNTLKAIENKNSDEEKQLRRTEEKIAVLFFKISEGLLRRPNFCNYDTTTKENMISDAVFNCLKASERYDVNFKNPFAYFTQISFNAFRLNIKDMKKRTGLMVNINHLDNLDGCDDAVGD